MIVVEMATQLFQVVLYDWYKKEVLFTDHVLFLLFVLLHVERLN